jgi:hypothetical protein
MANRKLPARSLIIIILILLVSTSLCTSSHDTAGSEENNNSTPELELEKLYIGKYYLLPSKPGDDNTNKTELLANNQSIFGHNIFDRKFNDKLNPELNLWLEDLGVPGMILECELQIQAVEDSTEITGKKYSIIFENFTTAGEPAHYNVKLNFKSYQGKPFDIKSGKDTWASLTLIIRRVDSESDSKLMIYCGASGKASYLITPYDKTYSKYKSENEADDKGTPGFGGGMAIASIVVLVVIYYSNKLQNKRFDRN